MTDEDSYRKLFVAESIENHETIVNNILVLEEGSDDNAIDEIFRAAHTLKGMSASMGYMQMEHLCHKMEDVFHCIRNGEIGITQELTDIFLACTDRIEEMIEDIESGGDSSSIEAEDLVEKLKNYETNGGEEETYLPETEDTDSDYESIISGANSEDIRESTESEDPSQEHPISENPVIPKIQKYIIKIEIADDCNMKDIRALIVLQNLEELGHIVSSKPTSEEIDEGIIEDKLEIIIESDSGEEALKSAASITDIKSVLIEPVGEDITEKTPEYRLFITIEPECGMKDVRAMIVIQNLEKLGNIISTSPSLEEIDSGEIKDSFEVILSSEEPESKIQNNAYGTEIKGVKIEPYNPELPSKEQITPEVLKSTETTEEISAPEPEIQLEEFEPGDLKKKDIKPLDGEKETPNRDKNKDSSKKREVKNLRVDISRLDQMMNLVEDLVINGGRLKQIAKEHQIKEMDEALNMVSRSISDLQNLTMYIRMIPLNHIFNRFPRVVRDVAHHDGKEVEFIMTGGETELDRSVIDGLGDPLLHLIRNGVNHGIETPDVRIAAGKDPKGTVTLSAFRDQGNVVIQLSDDGKGISRKTVLRKAIEKGLLSEDEAENLPDEEVPGLLFLPGFSTAEVITDISGRGVGLDVVKSAIESLKGSIKVKSVEGEGSTFTLTLPPTMAIIEVMMVRINNRRCAIPINAVVEVAKINLDNINRIGKSEGILLRDEVLQLHRLDEMFGQAQPSGIIVILQYQGSKCCIPVDVVEGQQEIVVKPVSNIIGTCPGVGGVTIPGDGDVVPILDVNTMII
ncbi:MAG: chemotaxis protein CheA [Methanomicrobiaceae archaeon]|nr:chemotaxis protein CheA [Methanomicrobiaceae archaeon]